MKHFIVVGKSERVVVAVLQGIKCFTKAKCTVIGDHETSKLSWSALCSRHIPIQFDQAPDLEVIKAINEIHKANPEAVVIPADCPAIRLVSRIQSQLHLPVTPIPEPETLDQMDDKWKFHEFCSEHNLNVPTTCYVGSKANLNFEEMVLKLGLPFVLKPSNESGSLGVQVIRSKEHYLKAIEGNDAYRFNSLIAQHYIEGEDIDLSLLAIHGRLSAFAIQQASGPRIKFVQNSELQALATRLCAASGFHGLMHIDARIEKSTGKVFLIESNPRFWASLTASVWCGLNFVEESIKASACADTNAGICVPLSLVSGTAYTRHPILRPAAWLSLVRFDQRGRLTRSATLDLYSLGKFTADLPVLAGRYLSKFLVRGFTALRNAHTIFQAVR
ncbi:ATP-grasp domain-containing protein [Oxalobacteraceae bacterium R-40]|uniref:ATP-grasp domain-containing protein n=1 Tax=Keguizhuia sedimenti TaxID=3064264 RepID=A0ABU1BPD0_9BURK|nr:ATP-grasp domain-containing protein [Oxalobacteraceae bacterium R-40]